MESLEFNEKVNDASYIMNMKAFEYHELSKLTNYNHKKVGLNISRLKNSGFVKQMMKSYKIYPNSMQIDLPKSNLTQPLNLQELIVNRRSRRNFKEEIPIKLEEIAQILQLSYGATAEFEYEGEKQILRSTPSAGALYPLEIYILARNVEDLEKAVYHYRVCQHSLEKVKPIKDVFFENLEKNWFFPKGAQAIFLITGVWNRSFLKYMERAYRYLLIEAGAVAENMTIIAEAQKLNALMMGGWNDDEFNALLNIDGLNEVSLLPICIGACE
jgi:SagB-type dehydrogenase family enzyme